MGRNGRFGRSYHSGTHRYLSTRTKKMIHNVDQMTDLGLTELLVCAKLLTLDSHLTTTITTV